MTVSTESLATAAPTGAATSHELGGHVSTAPAPREQGRRDARLDRVRITALGLVRRPSLLISGIVLIVVVLWALAPGLFTHFSPVVGDSNVSYSPPSAAHWFGTDQLGRDLYARTVYGASTTLSATLLAVVVGFVVGSAIGLTSGFLGGRWDSVIMRFVDVLLSIPSLLLAMTIVAALGYGTVNVAIAVGIGSIASFARVMRSEVVKVVKSDYVEAAYGLGASRLRVILRHVVPNSGSSVLALSALEFGAAVLAVAGLGFLGYGAPPPQPEWGLSVAEGRDVLAVYPWIALIPGVVIAVVVLATNRVSKAVGS
jgi:peptide/nickel transport system permease protein